MVALWFVVVGNRERVKEDRPSCFKARAKAEIIVFGFDGFQVTLQGLCSTYCMVVLDDIETPEGCVEV